VDNKNRLLQIAHIGAVELSRQLIPHVRNKHVLFLSLKVTIVSARAPTVSCRSSLFCRNHPDGRSYYSARL
jgi:hypothetical protein